MRVLLLNTDPAETFRVEPGDRIAQLVIVADRASPSRSRPRRWPTPPAATAASAPAGASLPKRDALRADSWAACLERVVERLELGRGSP